MDPLPTAEVVDCYFDESFQPRLSAMRLRWEADAWEAAERLWYLPEGVCLMGPPPERFGIHLQRQGRDAYAVRVLWNQTCLHWPQLSAAALVTSALTPLLIALGTDIRQLLRQPVAARVALPRMTAA